MGGRRHYSEAFEKAGRTLRGVDRRHEGRAAEHPERRGEEFGLPPLPPLRDRRRRHAERVEPTHGSSRTGAGSRVGGDHGHGDEHALAEKAHGKWRKPAAAVSAAEAVAEGVLRAGLPGAVHVACADSGHCAGRRHSRSSPFAGLFGSSSDRYVTAGGLVGDSSNGATISPLYPAL